MRSTDPPRARHHQDALRSVQDGLVRGGSHLRARLPDASSLLVRPEASVSDRMTSYLIVAISVATITVLAALEGWPAP